MLQAKNILKNVLIVVLITSSTLLIIDLISFIATPKQGISFVPHYKKNRFEEKLKEAIHYFPRGYNVADPIMGFDIQKNVPPVTFNMADGSFAIFSNEIGCFDHHTLAEIKAAKSYDYFAGDSFAWGYGNYEKNIPSTYEKESNRFTVKCGIIHSGQKHQFEKFQRTIKLIGKPPKRVILTFYENDVANDYAYPHTTVIEGYEVDTLRFNPVQFQLIPRDMNQIKQDIQAGINPQSQKLGVRIDASLDEYSLTWNLLKIGLQNASKNELETIYGIGQAVDYGKDKSYATSEVTKKNRDALDLWINDSKAQGYELIMVLIPPKIHHGNTHFYKGLKDYLESKKVKFLDLTEPFHDSKKRSEELYWLNDGHLNNDGNVFVGKYLTNKVGK